MLRALSNQSFILLEYIKNITGEPAFIEEVPLLHNEMTKAVNAASKTNFDFMQSFMQARYENVGIVASTKPLKKAPMEIGYMTSGLLNLQQLSLLNIFKYYGHTEIYSA